MRYLPEETRDKRLMDNMKKMIPLAFDTEKGEPTIIAGRIQNTAGLISICSDAWQATNDPTWLTLGVKLADFLINHYQWLDGSSSNLNRRIL